MYKSQNFTMKIPWPKFNMKRFLIFVLIIVLLLPSVQLRRFKRSNDQIQPNLLHNDACPKLLPKYFENVNPIGKYNEPGMNYTKDLNVKTKEDCVKNCCLEESCNMVFMVYTNDSNLTCYHVSINNFLDVFIEGAECE